MGRLGERVEGGAMIKKQKILRFKKTIRFLSICIGILSFSLGLLPLSSLIFNAGSAVLLLFGGTTILLSLIWNRFDGWGKVPRRLHEVSDHRIPMAPRWWRILRMALLAGLLVSVLAGTGFSTAMIFAIRNPPGDSSTVIVLGCKIYGNQPSPMLQQRLNVALSYLREHPETPVICSGGKGRKEQYSEARVMAQYLYENGVGEEQIYLEENSVNTAQNLQFSAKIIQEQGLPTQVAIATDGFHQLRSQCYAKINGLEGKALPSPTSWHITPCYWCREWIALLATFFRWA